MTKKAKYNIFSVLGFVFSVVPVLFVIGAADEDFSIAYLSVVGCDDKNVYLSVKLDKVADSDKKLGLAVNIGK